MRRYIELLQELKKAGLEECWLVGGAVRDSLLGRTPTDVDVVCRAADPAEIVARVGGAAVGKPPFCTVDTTFRGHPLEIALLTGGSLTKDLERRDFTINALAMDADGVLVDPFGGRSDLERGVLRTVAGAVSPYEADPLRVLRLLRFSVFLDFEILPETERAAKDFIRRHRQVLRQLPKERCGKEFLKGFAARPYDFLRLLDQYGLLPLLLPEIEALRGVEQPPAFHPEGDVLAHTFRVLSEAQNIIRTRPTGGDIVLALAALFHDVGKPRSARPHPKYGHTCFFGHEEEGERIAAETLVSWAVPGQTAGEVAALVRYHMLPGGGFTERTCVKLLRRIGPQLSGLLFELALCDARGAMGNGENILAARRLFQTVEANLCRSEREGSSPKRCLNGKDVMDIKGIPPGPLVGRYLEELDVAIGTGTVQTREEAICWLRRA